jgi:hypothetical protein
MRSSANNLSWRAIVLIVLTLAAIEAHELGHLAAYHAFGYSAAMSLQRVMPPPGVPHAIDILAKLAGPVTSLGFAAMLIGIARGRASFAWSTAAFTNATLRLLPLAMDVQRAVRGMSPFSDGGEVARAITGSPMGRVGILIVFVAASMVLTVMAARTYGIARRRAVAIGAIYLATLATGIAVIIADELLGWDRPPAAATPPRSNP